jgi:hypothetical protein
MSFLVQRKGVPALQEVAPWVDPRVARVVHGALIRSPEARWPTVGELVLGLEMVVGFDVARAPLATSALAQGLSAEAKAVAAPRAAIPQHWEELLRS